MTKEQSNGKISTKGRKTGWEFVKDKLDLVEEWASKGAIDKQLAKNLGICTKTLANYKNQYPEFAAAIRRGKEVVDYEVEASLFKRAMGMQVTETKTTTMEDGSVVVTETVKTLPPDATSMIFWLKNRKPSEWKDKVQNEISTGEEGININVNLTE